MSLDLLAGLCIIPRLKHARAWQLGTDGHFEMIGTPSQQVRKRACKRRRNEDFITPCLLAMYGINTRELPEPASRLQPLVVLSRRWVLRRDFNEADLRSKGVGRSARRLRSFERRCKLATPPKTGISSLSGIRGFWQGDRGMSFQLTNGESSLAKSSAELLGTGSEILSCAGG